MANPITNTITVPVTGDLEPLKRQLAVLRNLCSQIGFAIDQAILALDTTDEWPDAERHRPDHSDGCPSQENG